MVAGRQKVKSASVSGFDKLTLSDYTAGYTDRRESTVKVKEVTKFIPIPSTCHECGKFGERFYQKGEGPILCGDCAGIIPYPHPIKRDSRIAFGIEWFATEEEADHAGSIQSRQGWRFGRDKGFDYEKDGVKYFAVKVP